MVCGIRTFNLADCYTEDIRLLGTKFNNFYTHFWLELWIIFGHVWVHDPRCFFVPSNTTSPRPTSVKWPDCNKTFWCPHLGKFFMMSLTWFSRFFTIFTFGKLLWLSVTHFFNFTHLDTAWVTQAFHPELRTKRTKKKFHNSIMIKLNYLT